MKPLSLYIHVPFCTRRCSYCSFYHVQSIDSHEASFVAALVEEIDEALAAQPVDRLHTVFIGGGTPSVLSTHSWDKIFATLSPYLRDASEFTVEMNPEDVTEVQLRYLREHGVDRVSLGVQSMNAIAQKVLKRCSPETNRHAIDLTLRHFDNVSFDVLLGIPGSNLHELEQTLSVLVAYEPMHFSVYCLEPGGDMSQEVERFFTAVDPERSTDEYLHACEALRERGYRHYEISNFARPGFESKHNRAYWDLSNYIGVGPAAHSYVEGRRFANAPSLVDYLNRRTATRVVDRADADSAPLESMILGLRTDVGVPVTGCREDAVASVIAEGLADIIDDRLRLTDRGFLLTNEILLRLQPASAGESTC